jgi:hypothetical protein
LNKSIPKKSEVSWIFKIADISSKIPDMIRPPDFFD